MNIDSLVLKNSHFSFSFAALCVVSLIFSTKISIAQTLPVGISENMEDSVRRSQLLGRDTSRMSYMIRPINFPSDSSRSKFKILPLLWVQQFNSHHPYGINDGSMILSKGYQTMISGGVFAKYGPLSIQLRPEFVFAENKDYRELSEIEGDPAFKAVFAKQFYNKIDMPGRFGKGEYAKVFWGQSNIRLTLGPVSLGVANENLWWGPGFRNSLLMTNNAPGFKHITLNTSRPLIMGIGAFEFQVVGGKLESSNVEKLDGSLYSNKRDDWRYLSGVAATFQPKWVPGLYLGFDRSFIMYHKDLEKFSDFFPLFSSIAKSNFNNVENTVNSEDQLNRDQYISFFARWVLPQSKAELYFQFGRNDHGWDLRDVSVEPEHSRAYIAGFKKLVPLRSQDEYLQVGLEFTQLQGSGTSALRIQPPWYVHHQVRAGYTNSGQVLGAGIGSGSNLQTIDLAWVKGLKRIGFQIERQVQNHDLFGLAYSDSRRRWVDLSLGGKLDYDFNRFLFFSQLVYIRSLNYQYRLIEQDTFWDWGKQDVDNVHVKLGVLYNF